MLHPLSSCYSRIFLPTMALTMLLFTLSCSTWGKPKHNMNDLLLAEQDFIKAMKWGDYKHASGWIAPEAKEDFWRNVDGFQNHLHIMDYDIRDVIFEGGDGFSTVLLKCRYYFTSDPQLKTKTLRQKWTYGEEPSGWQLQQHALGELLVQ